MEVSEIVEIARKISNAHARIARVLTRLKPVLKKTGTTVLPSWSDPVEIVFWCKAVESAEQVAAVLPVKLGLHYTGHSSLMTFETEIADVKYEFRVPTIRKITIDECDMVRKKRRNWNDWHDAYLYFNEYELQKISYRKAERVPHKVLKERLWKAAIEHQPGNHRLERFEFVL